jgi:hypothetical protein
MLQVLLVVLSYGINQIVLMYSFKSSCIMTPSGSGSHSKTGSGSQIRTGLK